MNEEALFVLLNKNAEIVEFQDPSSITGYSIEEVIKRNWFEVFIHNVDQTEIMLVFTSLFSNEAPHWTYDNRIICKNGEKNYYVLTIEELNLSQEKQHTFHLWLQKFLINF